MSSITWPPALRLEQRRSRWLQVVLLLQAALASLGVMLASGLPAWRWLLLPLPWLALYLWQRQYTDPASSAWVRSASWDGLGRWTLVYGNGRIEHGVPDRGAVVLPFYILLPVRTAHGSRSVVWWPDSADATALRRLRVLLRWCPPTDDDEDEDQP